MIRVFLIVLGGPLLFLALIQTVDYLDRPEPGADSEMIAATLAGHRGYAPVARAALLQYRNLSPAEQNEFHRSLNRHLRSPVAWARRAQDRFDIICLGEEHRNSTRRFIARHLLPLLELDLLALEATDVILGEIDARLAKAEKAFLLGAEIDELIRIARRRNPQLEVIAIDHSREIAGVPGSDRESVMIGNFMRSYRSGDQALILLGALHCGNRGSWLLAEIRRRPELAHLRIAGVRVVADGRDGSVQSFVEFLRAIGVSPGIFVIDSESSHDWLAPWFPLLRQQLLDRYDAVVYFAKPDS